MYELIITEKPSAAKKIAEALAGGKVTKKGKGTVAFYDFKRKSQRIVVCCAAGHLYTVAEKKNGKWTYPVFDIEWKESYKASKSALFTKKYLDVILDLCKKANKFTVATDYDIEGEVIGYNIVRFACGKKNAQRMKYSTLTKDELVNSYDHVSKKLDEGQKEAGITRHELDFYYGINLSRAMTLAIKNATKHFKVMSSGRVQGPALAMLAEREKEIQKFVSEPYWEIEMNSKEIALAKYKKGKIWDKKKANSVMKKVKGKKAIIDSITKRKQEKKPPYPFDLTALQLEAHKVFKMSPKETLQAAQTLYLGGYISYPRTSSNQIPPAINVKAVMEKLKKQKDYSDLASELISSKRFKPNNGRKTDPAHPAIYPTGDIPKVSGYARRLYDLIVRRFLATFAPSAKRESVSVGIKCNSEEFGASGSRTLEPGWMKFYGKYVKFEEQEFKNISEGQKLTRVKFILLDKETQPPNRYNSASIIKELEKRNLGTKATRSQIVENLFDRNYVVNEPIEVTDLGMKVVDTLKKYSPDILDEELTRHFETEMEKIREKKSSQKTVLEKARKILTKILKNFKKNEIKIGKRLDEANLETMRKESYIGKCPICKKGDLIIKRSKYGKLIGCSNYPKCEAVFNIPSSRIVEGADKKCPECGYPMILVSKSRRARKQEVCINENCPTRVAAKKKEEELIKRCSGKKCPECGSDLIVRKSFFGYFLGCSNYPKCKHYEPIDKVIMFELGFRKTDPRLKKVKKTVRRKKVVKKKTVKKKDIKKKVVKKKK